MCGRNILTNTKTLTMQSDCIKNAGKNSNASLRACRRQREEKPSADKTVNNDNKSNKNDETIVCVFQWP